VIALGEKVLQYSFMKQIKIEGRTYNLPMYLPDATRAVVKSVDAVDLMSGGVEGVVVNTYHLMGEPGLSVLKEFKGIKNFMGFDGLVVSDSGGWQIFSLIHRSNMKGSITDRGVTFSVGKHKSKLFSPEKSIQTQFGIGSDLIVCLDDFSPPGAEKQKIEQSVERTLLWAKKSKKEYERLVEKKGLDDKDRPLLLSVVQGDRFMDLRQSCADELVKIGFDGYGFGGYPMDEEGKFDFNLAKKLAKMLPDDKLKFALGVGAMHEIATCFGFGWDIFDCTLPTRDGRHKRLYVWAKEPKNDADFTDPAMYGFVYIHREKYRRDERPISFWCDCLVCKKFSRAYLSHLFAISDTLAYRLASIHNVAMYVKLMEKLRKT